MTYFGSHLKLSGNFNDDKWVDSFSNHDLQNKQAL